MCHHHQYPLCFPTWRSPESVPSTHSTSRSPAAPAIPSFSAGPACRQQVQLPFPSACLPISSFVAPHRRLVPGGGGSGNWLLLSDSQAKPGPGLGGGLRIPAWQPRGCGPRGCSTSRPGGWGLGAPPPPLTCSEVEGDPGLGEVRRVALGPDSPDGAPVDVLLLGRCRH